LHRIRENGAALLKLQCVLDAAEKLRAEQSDLLETPDSDGRAEAVIQVLKKCIEAYRNTTDGRVLSIMLDLDGRFIGTSARQRRTIAGEWFRGKNGTQVGESRIRQHYERKALNRLTDDLLAYEDAHIARHDG
jgi:hypothetical protein